MCAARERGGEGFDYTTCPVCSQQINGSPEELNDHVECCLNTVESVCYITASRLFLWLGGKMTTMHANLNGNKLGLCSVLSTKDSLCCDY